MNPVVLFPSPLLQPTRSDVHERGGLRLHGLEA